MTGEVELRRSTVYQAPSTRLCRWVSTSRDSASGVFYSTFVYLPRQGDPHGFDERFFLSEPNYWMLKVVG